MTSLMKMAVEVDEKSSSEINEKIESLFIENQGLKELLEIKNKYNDRQFNNNKDTKVTTVDAQCQTDDS
jgi:hypothetical protein